METSIKPFSQRSGQRSCACDFSVPHPAVTPVGPSPSMGHSLETNSYVLILLTKHL